MKRKDGYKCVGKCGKICDLCKLYLEKRCDGCKDDYIRWYEYPEEFEED